MNSPYPKTELFEHKDGFIKIETITDGKCYGRDGKWYAQFKVASGGSLSFNYDTEVEARQAVNDVMAKLKAYISCLNEKQVDFEKRLAKKESQCG